MKDFTLKMRKAESRQKCYFASGMDCYSLFQSVIFTATINAQSASNNHELNPHVPSTACHVQHVMSF